MKPTLWTFITLTELALVVASAYHGCFLGDYPQATFELAIVISLTQVRHKYE